MCGIVGAAAKREVGNILLEGLRRLEYRGYDSAGLAILNSAGNLERLRRLGKVQSLNEAYKEKPLEGSLGIAHTRWATHGKPSEKNAHPHQSGGTAIVHNGIIENHETLKSELEDSGYIFESDTDSEVIAHQLHFELKHAKSTRDGMISLLNKLEGAYAIAVVDETNPEKIFAARLGSPLVLGLGIGENYLASDPQALRPVTDRFIFLEDEEIVELTKSEISIFGHNRDSIERRAITLDARNDPADKGNFRHYMQKEIFEQPEAVKKTLAGRMGKTKVLVDCFGVGAESVFQKVKSIQIIGCGSSYYSGLVAKYWFEQLIGVSCQVDIASEFRYRKNVVHENTILVAISQSGETADTLAAVRNIKDENYLATLSLCNTPNSSLVRETDFTLMMEAGVEICVASTKAFTNQLVNLLMLVSAIGESRGCSPGVVQEIFDALNSLPSEIEEILNLDIDIERISERFVEKNNALFLGRGTHYPIALEGALKLKEISYIHAEAYPAGELKHGPLALVDDSMPVVAVAPSNELIGKLKSNLEEVRARGAQLLIFADESISLNEESALTVLKIPACSKITSPILYTIPVQLLAYHVAVFKGTDVDQPRNLAKSVTVE